MTKAQQYHAIRKMPSALEYFSYVWHFQSLMAGPLVFYKDYIEFVEGCNLRPTANVSGMKKKAGERNQNEFCKWLCGQLHNTTALSARRNRERKCGGNSQQSNASCADLTAVPLSALAVYLSVLPPLSDSSISICLAAFLSLVWFSIFLLHTHTHVFFLGQSWQWQIGIGARTVANENRDTQSAWEPGVCLHIHEICENLSSEEFERRRVYQ